MNSIKIFGDRKNNGVKGTIQVLDIVRTGEFSEGICDTDRRNTHLQNLVTPRSLVSHCKQSSSHKTVKTIKIRTIPVVQHFAEVVNELTTGLRDPKRDIRQKLIPFKTTKT